MQLFEALTDGELVKPSVFRQLAQASIGWWKQARSVRHLSSGRHLRCRRLQCISVSVHSSQLAGCAALWRCGGWLCVAYVCSFVC